MKILLIHCAYKYRGGEDTVFDEETRLLRSNGVEVETLKFDNHDHSLRDFLFLPFNYPSFKRTVRCLQLFKPDLVHVHNLHFAGSPSVLAAVKKMKLPLVMTLHNFRLLCPSATLFHNGKPFLRSLYERFPWTAVLRGVYNNSRPYTFWTACSMMVHRLFGFWNLPDKYIVLSQHAKGVFQSGRFQLKNEKMVVKPNFCYVPLIAEGKKSNYFLYIGRLTEEKGMHLLLDAFSRTELPVKIAGDGPMKDIVIEYTREHPNIEYISSVDKAAVFALMQEATALVFPSIWYEGMPLTIIEAFASGLPVIASKFGVMENMIVDKHNGLHFNVGSVSDLRQKLHQWNSFSDTDKREFDRYARQTYEQLYTPEVNILQLLNIYNSALNRNHVDTGNFQRNDSEIKQAASDAHYPGNH